MRASILTATSLMLVLAFGSAAAQKQPERAAQSAAPAGNAENGRTLYARDGCYECHNYAANGGAAGPRLAPRPIAYGEFSRSVRKPTGEMPPYTSKVLSDAELADIYAFLQTVR